ncbi:MAG: NUDIX hydrolase [Chthoniobacteraceae bacterium]|nr:NUDIX hydrolase [Chthoniobacteraceae bacterium]
MPANLPWLDWAKQLAAVAQNGLTFAKDPFDVERYEAVRKIAAELLAAGSGVPVERVLTLLESELGYCTPKVDVRAAVFREGRLLLVRERSDGGWTLPGGWADPCQSAAECVAREVEEESGFQVRPVELLAVFDRSKHPHEPPFASHVYKLFFRCELTGGAPADTLETDGCAFFAEDALPPLSLTRITPDELAAVFEHGRNPGRPAVFD